MLIYQAFLTLGKKMPSGDDAKIFNDGWISSLKAVPTEALKDAFSDALASGKPFTPGTVVSEYFEKIQVNREELKRHPDPEEIPFPLHATLIEAKSGRPYHFALEEPLFCVDCGRPAEAFRAFERGRKVFFCLYHARIESPQPSESFDEIPS